MNNHQFLRLIAKSFIRFLETSARSNAKLKILHKGIGDDLKNKLGNTYSIKSLGIGDGKEGKLDGRYIDKVVDILVSKRGKNIAGIGIKFVMNNYSQNSNNYFENMLGETANIRANKKKYFQIFILPEEMPYYDNNGIIKKWERVTKNNVNKYIVLSNDNVDAYLHTPIKTLVFIVKFPTCPKNNIKNKKDYITYYLGKKNINFRISSNVPKKIGEAVIVNNYEEFISKTVYYLKSI